MRAYGETATWHKSIRDGRVVHVKGEGLERALKNLKKRSQGVVAEARVRSRFRTRREKAKAKRDAIRRRALRSALRSAAHA